MPGSLPSLSAMWPIKHPSSVKSIAQYSVNDLSTPKVSMIFMDGADVYFSHGNCCSFLSGNVFDLQLLKRKT